MFLSVICSSAAFYLAIYLLLVVVVLAIVEEMQRVKAEEAGGSKTHQIDKTREKQDRFINQFYLLELRENSHKSQESLFIRTTQQAEE